MDAEINIKSKKNNKSQITIFVIIALIIVVSIALIFVLVKPSGTIISPAGNPQGYIEKCMSDSAKTAVTLLLPSGGYVNLQEPNLNYSGRKIAFLCYTQANNELCINKEPMLANRIENEIKDYTSPKIESCFNTLKKQLANYNPQFGETNLEIKINPKQISMQLNKDVSYTKDGQTIVIKKFNAAINSKMWDFVSISNRIINEELTCKCGVDTCNAYIVKISLQNPGFEVGKFMTGNNEEIYSIQDELSKDKFVFAVRNCVRLP